MNLTMHRGARSHPVVYQPATYGAALSGVAERDAAYLLSTPKPVAWSKDAIRLFEHLETPPRHRPFVPYNRAFVDSYVPNESSLLPPALAEQLFQACRWYETLPRGAFARAVEEPFVLDLSWSSSQLEGNSLSRQQTQALFSLGTLLDGAGAEHDDEVRMLINHKSAIEYMVRAAPNQRLCIELMLAMHDRLMDRLIEDPMDRGRIRDSEVEICGSSFEPEQRPEVLRELLDVILAKADAVRNPVEAAFFLWVNLAYLQAFVDGNKRTSRLAANVPLLLRNCAPISFEGIAARDYGLAMLGVYERNDVSAAVDLFTHTYRRSMQKYVVMLADRPRADPRMTRYRDELRRVVPAIVVQRRSAAAAIAYECLAPSDAADFGGLVVERLKSLTPRHGSRFDIDDGLIDAWIAAGRPY